MEYNYETLLKKAKANLPSSTTQTERFEIPKVQGHVQGNKTIISNFNQICSTLRRDPQHLLKYLQRELATPAQIDGPRLILGRKLLSTLINAKIEQYTNNFVICRECKKPDTKLIKEDRVYSIKCMACGAKHPIKAKI
ncbi:MAG: translation initiation factor IF-2 subunit beta [Candidatus Woesearchaeota archaeon]|nr:translation initiation factor IF-2 subunit beta [Candidatus Woesearchaeota archaeon]